METKHSKRRIRWGCHGWEHERWIGAYYPDDLPPDWRLAYYANEATCVLLPHARVRGATRAEVESWCREVAESFLFFLEGGDQPLPPFLTAGLSERLGGVLDGMPQPGLPRLSRVAAPEGEAWATADRTVAVLALVDSGSNLRQWRARLAALDAWFRDYVELALLVEGAEVDPRRLAELRLLTELMGIA
jgi:hypothetical protein